jgi:hypothetical protein
MEQKGPKRERNVRSQTPQPAANSTKSPKKRRKVNHGESSWLRLIVPLSAGHGLTPLTQLAYTVADQYVLNLLEKCHFTIYEALMSRLLANNVPQIAYDMRPGMATCH